MKKNQSKVLRGSTSVANDGSTKSILELPHGCRFEKTTLVSLLQAVLRADSTWNKPVASSVDIVLEKSEPLRQYIEVEVSCGTNSSDVLRQYIQLIERTHEDPLIYNNLKSHSFAYVD